MPKLRYSATSPYVRKVMIVAKERGLDGTFDLVPTVPKDAADLPEQNPLAKVPTLVLDDGSSLYDSVVICEWLDSMGKAGQPVFPAPGPARWTALRQHALANGMTDSALLIRGEVVKTEEAPNQSLIDLHRGKILKGLGALEAEAGKLGDALTIGTIAVMVVLGYLDFRFDHEKWRTGRPQLSQWFDRAAQRASFADTAPPA